MRDILAGMGRDEPLLSTRELASRYDVSVIVVREALARLQARGALERRQGRRARVARPDHSALVSILQLSTHHDDIPTDEMQDCRAGLEAQAATLAALAPLSPEAKREALAPSLEAMRANIGRRSATREFNDSDLAFHEAVAELSGNRPIKLILAALHEVIREAINVTYTRVERRDGHHGIETALAMHEHIAQAICAGDADAARAAVAAHFAYSGLRSHR